MSIPRYDPKRIEPKWQDIWNKTQVYKTPGHSEAQKSYILDFFPYPSGVAMHMGHVRNYAISDVVARFERMQGKSVLHPMGWDAFGLPAENHAIKEGITPRQAIDENTERFKKQFELTGMSYDWSREIDSSKPEYYKWTQWFFLLLLKRGLAYRAEGLQNWCPKDKTVLANEQVIVDGEKKVCERCGSEVEKKRLKQWFFKITDYADRLIDDLDDIDWPHGIKEMQRNWIGRSVGANVKFKIAKTKHQLEIFTTRVDTIFGATFMVLAPEHPLVEEITSTEMKNDVQEYLKKTANKTELQRQQDDKSKTGVFTGAFAINPATKTKIPIWISDFVLMGYGTGAIMAVPANDQRDMEFADKYNLPVVGIIKGQDEQERAFGIEGTLINSDKYDGMDSAIAREKITHDLVEEDLAVEAINYKLRDWLISRQRYWGAPIPIIHCDKCGEVPVPESQLPIELPSMQDFHPSDDGRGPLARAKNWVNTKCPECGGEAERETDTMDGFACSSWYFLRFADPDNAEMPFDPELVRHWLPVDTYIGGAEHAVLHLMYARFWTKVMYDAKLIEFDEPFLELRNQGMLLAEDGQKISKRLGNYMPPEKFIEDGYGADSLRTTVLFLAPYDQETAWSSSGLAGIYRYLNRVWDMVFELKDSDWQVDADLETSADQSLHKTIKKVTHDLDSMRFNTAIAALMEHSNTISKLINDKQFGSATFWRAHLLKYLKLIAPFAPHMSEELWQHMDQDQSIHIAGWPSWDNEMVQDEFNTIVIQVNGKVRADLQLPRGSSDSDLVQAAKSNEKIATYLKGARIVKEVVVPGKLVNFVLDK